MPSGLNAETFTKIIAGQAKIFVGSTNYGTTRGPPAFSPGVTTRNLPFDGKVADVALLDREVYRMPTMTVTLLELTSAKILALTPGASTASAGGVTTVTPPLAQAFLTPLTDVRAIWKMADATFLGVRFKKARAQITGLSGGAADDEATAQVTFTGMADGTSDATMHVSPHVWETAATEALILAAP